VGGFAAVAAGCNRSPEGQAPPPVQKDKTRTLKYYPPPNDEETMTVDVIDHGSEVLIVRRDPSPLRGSPSTSVLLGASPRVGHGAVKTIGSGNAPPLMGGRSSLLMQEPTLGRTTMPAPMAPPQVQQARPDNADSLQAKTTDASL